MPSKKTPASSAAADEQTPETPDLPKPEPAPEMLEIPYNGFTFVIPKHRDDWPTSGMAALAEEKYNLFVRDTLEIAKPGQWEVLCKMCPRKRDFAQFFAVFGPATQECIG